MRKHHLSRIAISFALIASMFTMAAPRGAAAAQLDEPSPPPAKSAAPVDPVAAEFDPSRIAPPAEPIPAPDPIPPLELTPPADPAQGVQPVPMPTPAPEPVLEPEELLDVSLMVGKSEVLNGEVLDAMLFVNARDSFTGVNVVLALPKGLEYVDGSAPLATFDPKASTLTWTGITVGPGTMIVDGARLRVEVDTVPDKMKLTLTTEAPGFKRIKEKEHVVAVGEAQPSQAVSKSAGGRVVVKDRITVDFPADALATDSAIESVVFALAPAADAATPPDVRFSLGPDQKFDKPVQVKVDLAGLVDVAKEDDQRSLVLQHLRTEAIVRTMRTLSGEREVAFVVTTAEDVPSQFDPATGILTAQLEHFSNYQVGFNQPADPKPWKTGGTAPGVSLFRGAANYTYPIYTPALIDGLQPSIALQYSSAAGDSQVGGNTASLPPGEAFGLGRGWSMDVPKITRLVKRGWANVSGAYQFITDYKNLFTLELNGATYTLVPAVAGQPAGAYITDDYVPLKITRCNARVNLTAFPECDDYPVTSWGNPTGEYWHVKTPDGTLYLFGLSSNNTNLVSQYDPGNGAYSTAAPDDRYAGSSNGQIARAWFLHGVYSHARDLAWNGSSWVAANWTAWYQYESLNELIYNPLCGGCMSADDYRIRPTETQYGYAFDTSGTTQSTRYKVTFAYNAWKWLHQINVAWGTTPLRQYNIDYVQQNLGGEVIYNQTAVHEYHPSGGSWVKLPSPTFTYLNTGTPGNDKRLLQQVSNGYGAVWTFAYAAHSWNNGHQVTRKTVNSGGPAAPFQITDYEYISPCFDNPGQPCYKPGREMPGSWLGGANPETNALMGYANTSEYHRDANNAILACTGHHFHHDEWARLGREYLTRNWSASCASILSARQTVHAVRSLTSQGVSAQRVVVDVVIDYPAGDWGTSPNVKVEYLRDSDNNPTSTHEYGLDTRADDDRSTHRWYGSNTDRWMIGLAQREDVHAGIVGAGGSGLESQAFVYYSGSPYWYSTPTSTRVVQVSRGFGSTYAHEAYGYNAIGNLVTVRDARSIESGNNYVTQAGYDSAGHYLTSITNALTQTTSYEYYGVNEGVTGGSGPRGALKRVIGPNGAPGDVTMFAYDLAGRLRKTVKYGDAWDAPTSEVFYVDANGASDWGATSAAAPFVVQTFTRKSPNHGTPSWGYDSKWWACAGCGLDTNALATWGRTLYDGLGREVQTQAPAPLWPSPDQVIATTIGYDVLGRVVTTTAPYTVTSSGVAFLAPPSGTRETATVYDALSRPTSVTGPDGVTAYTRYGVDNTAWSGFSTTSGLFVRTTDGNNHHKMAVTDGLGRSIRSREFTGTCTVDNTTCLAGSTWYDTKYTYDALGNTRFVTDTGGLQTEMRYDALGRKTWMSDPDMGVWTYAYDANGNLTSQVDAKNQTLQFQYDVLNRLTRKWGGTVEYQYYHDTRYDGSAWANGKGRLVEAGAIISGTWANSFLPSYDERGRQTRLWRAYSSGNSYYSYTAYDSADRVTSTTYPNSEVVTVGYNPAGYPTTLVGTNTYVYGATYNVLGKPSTISLGNGLTTRYQYHGLENEWPRIYWGNSNWGRLAQTCVYATGGCGTWDNGTPVRFNQVVTYDAAGNVISTSDPKADATMTWAYDALDRLTTVTAGGGANSYSASYTYAANGNMTYKSNLGTMNYAAKVDNNPAGRSIPHALSDIASTDYTGLVAKYDGNGNMYERWHQGTWFCQEFDIENRLTRIYNCSTPSNDVRFEYDAAGTLVKRTNSSGVWTHYIGPHAESTWGAWTNYYLFNGARMAVRNGSGLFFLHADHLGSASVTTDSAGNQQGSRRYYPYGEGILISGNQQTDRRFTGQRQEQDFGMYDYGARYYVPLLGRFISADTIVPDQGGPQALNRYSYVFNNPMRYTDPTGHDPFEDGTWWTEYCQYSACGAEPTDFDRQTWLFSLVTPGLASGSFGWNAQDWRELWSQGRTKIVGDWTSSDREGSQRKTEQDFANQIQRLASHYTDDEVDQFVRALGLLYAQIPYENYGGFLDAIIQSLGGMIGPPAPRADVPGCNGENDTCGWMHNMSFGWNPAFAKQGWMEQTHHYVGHLWGAYYLGVIGMPANVAGTVIREGVQGVRGEFDRTDVYLGWVGGHHGQALFWGLITPSQLAREIISPRGLK